MKWMRALGFLCVINAKIAFAGAVDQPFAQKLTFEVAGEKKEIAANDIVVKIHGMDNSEGVTELRGLAFLTHTIVQSLDGTIAAAMRMRTIDGAPITQIVTVHPQEKGSFVTRVVQYPGPQTLPKNKFESYALINVTDVKFVDGELVFKHTNINQKNQSILIYSQKTQGEGEFEYRNCTVIRQGLSDESVCPVWSQSPPV